MVKAIPALLMCVVLGAAAQLSIKTGVKALGELSLGMILSNPFRVFSNPFVLFGFIAYGVSSLLWLTLASKYPLALIYPMIALGYVFVVVGSKLIFKDETNVFTWLALAIIVLGVSLLAKGSPSN